MLRKKRRAKNEAAQYQFLRGADFVALKLTGVISWPWLWVWSPLLISYAVFILFFIIALIFGD